MVYVLATSTIKTGSKIKAVKAKPAKVKKVAKKKKDEEPELSNFIPHDHPRKDFFKILDRSMIYVLIAGSYTPLALLILPPVWGWSIFGTIWGLALVGILLKIFRVRIPRWFPTFMYLLMGWLIIIALVPLSALIPATGIFWLATGGILYTIGTIFFAFSSRKNYQPKYKWFTFHDAFHVLAMGGSLSHFWFMFHFVLPG